MKKTQRTSADDLRALEEIKKGNSKAFATIYDRYRPFIYRSALSFFKSEEEAKDATQDVLIHIYNKLLEGKFENIGFTLSSWVSTVSVNLLKDMLNHENTKRVERLNGISIDKKEDAEQFSAIESALFQISKSVHYDDHLNIVDNENLKTLHTLIDGKLSEREQKILALYFKKTKQKEIAELIGETHQSVRVTILRMKEKLAKMVSNLNTQENYTCA